VYKSLHRLRSDRFISDPAVCQSVMSTLDDPEDVGYRFEEQFENINGVAGKRRLEILFDGKMPEFGEDGRGGIVRFSYGSLGYGNPVAPETIRWLADEGYLSLEQQFNASPTVREMVRGAERVNSIAPETGTCRLIGYVVTPERSDCRITVEGSYYHGPVTTEVREEFKSAFGTGYEFSESDTHLRRWHD